MSFAQPLMLLLAESAPHVGWEPWEHGGSHMWFFGPFMFLFWFVAIATVVWFVSHSRWHSGNGGPRESSGIERAREILAERYARGEISTEEYWERRDQLLGH